MKNSIIIAEAGVNHNGDIKLAKKLIDVASDAGADYVKFQSFKAKKLVSFKAKKAKYQSKNLKDNDDSQYNMLKKLELTDSEHLELFDYCSYKNIKFLSTAFDIDGLHYLDGLGLDFFKVPSGEITNYPFLKAVAEFNRPVILSTGMSLIDEISDAIDVLLKFGLTKDKISILHCNTEYPTPYNDVNLLAMHHLKERFETIIGYSDHTLGIEVSFAAVAIGAKIIEKHFTLSRSLSGPDHVSSLEPNELKELVKGIRIIEKAISGDGKKKPSKSEIKNIAVARKSIHLKNNLKINSIISEDDLISLRPGDGISPMEWNKIIGQRINKDLEKYHKLSYNDLI